MFVPYYCVFNQHFSSRPAYKNAWINLCDIYPLATKLNAHNLYCGTGAAYSGKLPWVKCGTFHNINSAFYPLPIFHIPQFTLTLVVAVVGIIAASLQIEIINPHTQITHLISNATHLNHTFHCFPVEHSSLQSVHQFSTEGGGADKMLCRSISKSDAASCSTLQQPNVNTSNSTVVSKGHL
jgi:hypothetical protein